MNTCARWFTFLLLTLNLVNSVDGRSQPASDASKTLIAAEGLIDRGEHQKASSLILAIEKRNIAASQQCETAILKARILHENGQRIQAIGQLRSLLRTPLLQQAANARIKTEAYLLLADCYLFLNWMERFKAVNDTIRQLVAVHRLDDALRCRTYTNYIRYYNYLVLGKRAKPYLDSAWALLQLANGREKHRFQPLALLTAYVNYSRNYGGVKAEVRDSVLHAKHDLRNDPVFLQVHWWRTVGNTVFDFARLRGNNDGNRQWYSPIAQSFGRAIQILKKYYPNNFTDQVTLYNLRGLQDFYCGYFKLSRQHFENAENLLQKTGLDTLDAAPLYNNTLTYQLNTADSLYSGANLLPLKKKLLHKWEAFAPVWEQWMELEQNKELRSYRSSFSSGPYDIIVSLCYDLHQMEGGNEYVNRAFQAQEAGKARLMKNIWNKEWGILPPDVPPVSALQKSLSANQAILSLSRQGAIFDFWFYILISKDTVAFRRLSGSAILGSPAPLFGEPDSLCRSTQEFSKIFSHLYASFFDSAAMALLPAVKEIEIFHSNFSAQFNMGLLLIEIKDSGGYKDLPYLFRKYRLVHQYSWQSSRMLQSKISRATTHPFQYQAYIPDYSHTSVNRLPFFEKTGTHLSSQYGFETFLNGKSTLPQFMAYGGKATILHLAGHLQGADVKYAGGMEIILDSVKGYANTINTRVMDRIRLQADLVVLSLCESGLGDAYVQEGYVSMPYWFLVAGARSCIYSIWKLDEKAGSFIIERFYHHLSKGLRKSDALVHAQEDYLDQCQTEEERNPKYWAGLMLIGDDSPLPLKEKKEWHYLLLFLLPALMVWIWQRRRHRFKSAKTTNG